jgi:N4-(beta-N-acetylglucosaminyl)-L-asparaginase
MQNRRNFIRRAAAMAAILGLDPARLFRASDEPQKNESLRNDPLFAGGHIISTWEGGLVANAEAWKTIAGGGYAIDAVEAGVRVIEADAEGGSVGIGGMPDCTGRVTLDACIMDHTGNAGGVCFMEDIVHPISVARKVMDETPHVLLAGSGARDFAISQGFQPRDLTTPKSRAAYEKWFETQQYKPIINIENHDTIGLLAQDMEGRLSGACTTSGLAFKLRGRVGDSPIIGSGLYVDNEVGGATATGLGEAVMRTVGSFLVVELMRGGLSPQAACEEAVHRIVARMPVDQLQVGYLAMDNKGHAGAFAIHPGFNYARTLAGQTDLIDAAYAIE